MSSWLGRRLQIGIARETVRGAGAAPVYRIPDVEFDFDDKVAVARSQARLGRLEDSEETFITSKWGAGTLKGEVRSSSFPLLLYAMLGTLSSGSVVDSSYTHSVSLANTNLHQSLSLVAVDPNTSELYKLVVLDKLELNARLDEIVQFSATFLGKQAVATALTVPALTDEYKFTSKHVRVKVASTIGGLAAASPLGIKELRLTVSKNPVMDNVLFSAEPENIFNRQISVEGELTLNYSDETWKGYFKAATSRAMEIALVNSDETIGVGTSPSLTIQLPKVDFYEWAPNFALDDIVSQRLSFKASYDVANGLAVISTCQLVNTIQSYPDV